MTRKKNQLRSARLKIRLSIAQRLWIGFGLMLSLLAAAYLFALRMTSALDASLERPADGAQARSFAAADLRTPFDQQHEAVLSYLSTRDSAQLTRREAAQSRFDDALASYRGPGSTPDSQAVAQQVSDRYARYRAQADEAIRAADARAAAQKVLDAHAGEVRRLAAFMPSPAPIKGQVRSASKRETQRALAAKFTERARAFDDARTGAPRRNDDIATLLTRYEGLAGTRAEREWVKRAQRVLAEGDNHVAVLATAGQAIEHASAETSRLQRELDSLLARQPKPAAKADSSAVSARSAIQARSAADQLTNGLLLALMLGAVIALATTFAVRAPLQRLIASVRGYVDGDLSYRSLSMRGDEVGELRWIFDAMVGRLANAPPPVREPTMQPYDIRTALPEDEPAEPGVRVSDHRLTLS